MLELAKKYDRPVTQICLAWGLSRGYCVIPKASSDKNQHSNMEAFKLRLTDDEVKEVIKQLDTQTYLIKVFDGMGCDNIFA